MAAPVQYKTPGVYVVEQHAFPDTVVEVATAIPAFLGYTRMANDGSASIAGIPICIASFADYVRYFGGAPVPQFTLAVSADQTSAQPALVDGTRFFLYHSVMLYFLNGGGPAWVISVATFDEVAVQGRSVDDFTQANRARAGQAAPLDMLKEVPEVTLIVAPDTSLLPNASDCYTFWQQALAHCNDMQGRMALIDIHRGDQPRTHDPQTDVISGSVEGMREAIGRDFLKYGTAYYPWLNFDVVSEQSITFDNLDPAGLRTLATLLESESDTPAPTFNDLTTQVAGTETRADNVLLLHGRLRQASPVYTRLSDDMLKLANRLPPAAAIAGVYVQNDAVNGIWRAPANIGIAAAVSPTVDISNEDQEDLNMPLDGRAVNAIRVVTGRGLVVWGARTLDGNSQDWRYINVRRTLSMLEQSIKAAMLAYVFAPNDATTWLTVQNIIVNFLTGQWKAGALAGATPQDAFSVEVGLGSTMTGDDILDGYMRVMIKVAVVHPAEFIALTFQQQMQVS